MRERRLAECADCMGTGCVLEYHPGELAGLTDEPCPVCDGTGLEDITDFRPISATPSTGKEPPMLDPITETLRRADAFGAWLDELRAADATFAHASVLESVGWGEWQAACYLATGCYELWNALGDLVIAQRSFAPVVREHERPSRFWSGGEEQMIAWTAHFWLSENQPVVHVPWNLDQRNTERWLTAIRLRVRHAPPLVELAAVAG